MYMYVCMRVNACECIRVCDFVLLCVGECVNVYESLCGCICCMCVVSVYA